MTFWQWLAGLFAPPSQPVKEINSVLPITPPTPKPPPPPPPPAPVSTGEKLLEVDVSHWETPMPDYVKMKAEGRVKRVYVKATEHKIDSMLVANVKAAQAAGFPVGCYHFMHASEDGMTQAIRYMTAISGLKLELPHCLDWEGGSADGMSSAIQQKVAAAFIDYVEKKTGTIVEIYTGEAFMRALRVDKRFVRNPLWLAHYQTTYDHLNIPLPWTSLQGWQYSDAETVAGLAPGRHIDASWCYQ